VRRARIELRQLLAALVDKDARELVEPRCQFLLRCTTILAVASETEGAPPREAARHTLDLGQLVNDEADRQPENR
jgi:hypothetical protein